MEALISSLPPLDRLISDMLAHPWWYLGKSAGFVAYSLLLASIGLGIAVSSRIFDGLLGRPWVYELHRFLSILVLIAILFHALIMLPDPYARFTLKELLIPFQSHYKDGPMAIGIITLYGLAFVTVSFYVTKIIGQKTWRTLHYSTFALFVGATAHGVWTGTDSGRYAVQVFYLGSATTVLFLCFYRLLALKSARKEAKRRPEAAKTSSSLAPADATATR